MAVKLRKPIDISDFIDSDLFCNMHGITRRTLAYRLLVDQVHPRPIKYGSKHVFEPDAEIIIPPPKKGGGRPKGSTVANGAKKPGFQRKKPFKKINRKRLKIV
jgi:predicted DNA-binding transcriptional regulator AlpA